MSNTRRYIIDEQGERIGEMLGGCFAPLLSQSEIAQREMGDHAVRVEIERPLQGGNGFFEGALFLENSRAEIMQPRVELVRSEGFFGPVSGFDKLTEVGARARQ